MSKTNNLIERIKESGIIGDCKQYTRLRKSLLTEDLLREINDATQNCRDDLLERVFWIFNEIEEYPICSVCGNRFYPRFYGIRTTRNFLIEIQYCSLSCSQLSTITRSKIEKTLLQKTGYKHNFADPEVMRRRREKYFKKTGYLYPAQNPDCQLKMKSTCKKRYGVENPQQNVEIHKKSQQYRTKWAVLPSGKEITYQGFELVAIRELLKTFSENEIITRADFIPAIWYGEKSRYFPDIFIPSLNKIIEVKSTWTYGSETLNPKEYHRNLRKKEGTISAGFSIEFWICSNKEVLYKC